MTELETMQRAKMYMEKLANGINPIDDSVIPGEEVVNHVRLSRCFFYVANVLDQVIENGGIRTQRLNKKVPFYLPVARREMFAFSMEPITVSEIVKRINALISQEEMERLTTTMLTQWLLSVEMLTIVTDPQSRQLKRPTPRGQAMGIQLESRVGMKGEYAVVIYNLDAQHFVLDNLDAALEYAGALKEIQSRPWQEEDDRQLMDLYRKNIPLKELAVLLKRNPAAIRARLKKFGLTPQKEYPSV